MRPQRFSCGIRPRAVCRRRYRPASMRPQRFSCGIRLFLGSLCTELDASMRPQRFSCGISAACCPQCDGSRCFNEAAAFQLRNLPRAKAGLAATAALQ